MQILSQVLQDLADVLINLVLLQNIPPLQINQQPKTVGVMVDLHNSLDVFFNHLENTGSVSDKTLMKLMTLSLIDDYKDEMVACNP